MCQLRSWNLCLTRLRESNDLRGYLCLRENRITALCWLNINTGNGHNGATVGMKFKPSGTASRFHTIQEMYQKKCVPLLPTYRLDVWLNICASYTCPLCTCLSSLSDGLVFQFPWCFSWGVWYPLAKRLGQKRAGIKSFSLGHICFMLFVQNPTLYIARENAGFSLLPGNSPGPWKLEGVVSVSGNWEIRRLRMKL